MTSGFPVVRNNTKHINDGLFTLTCLPTCSWKAAEAALLTLTSLSSTDTINKELQTTNTNVNLLTLTVTDLQFFVLSAFTFYLQVYNFFKQNCYIFILSFDML